MAFEQERNKTLTLRLYEEVWNQGNLDLIDEVISPNFKDHLPLRFLPVPTRGRESLFEAATGFRGGFPDFHDEMIQIVAERDRVAYLGRITGTHNGRLFRFAPTGKKVSALGIYFFRFEDGKIVERWGVFDEMGLIQQMGVMPSESAGH